MTKPQTRAGHTPGRVPVTLTDRQIAQLGTLVWQEPGDPARYRGRVAMLAEGVEEALSMALTADEAATGPTPAGQRRAIARISTLATQLQQELSSLAADTWDELERDFDVYALDPMKVVASERPVVLPLATLCDAAAKAVARLEPMDSRGKRPAVGRNIAIVGLLLVFRSSTEATVHDYKGAAHDFVTAALELVGLSAPTSEEKFWALVPTELQTPDGATRDDSASMTKEEFRQRRNWLIEIRRLLSR